MDRENNNLDIAIVTFYSNLNYGAALQCYALQKYIARLGYDVNILDFKRGIFKRADSPFFISDNNIKSFFNMIRFLPVNIGKSYKKRRFMQNYFSLSKKFKEKELGQANKIYNCYIAGSDQIWNYNLTKSYLTCLLNFADDKAKKISYAGSFGISRLDHKYCDIYRELFERFDYISVREMQGKTIINDLGINKNVEVVLDPVFLLPKNQWMSIITKPQKENYILLYRFGNRRALDYALELAQKTGKELVYVSSTKKERGSFTQVRVLDPIEWLGWIAYADYIVTDSFHGTAFSIIFKKEFISFRGHGENATNSRLETLLSKAGLSERLFSDSEDENVTKKEIDYEAVTSKLAPEIKQSQDFITRALQGK